MKELYYCNSIRGNCGNCNDRYHYCNLDFLDFRIDFKDTSHSTVLSFNDNSYSKTFIDKNIFKILKLRIKYESD